MTDIQATWKTITIPTMVYLPTCSLDGAFKDTGSRVEPSDKVELLPGSRRIRINGVECQLLISTDSLPLDANNCLRLDRPAPPVASLSSGGDRAYVGATGQARARAQGNWDHENSAQWKGDEASHIGKDWVNAQIRRADKQGAFDTLDEEDLFENKPARTPSGFNPTVLDEQRVTRSVTLRDGLVAEVLLDPSSGREVSASRIYSGVGVNPKEAARMLSEQNAGARDVTHGGQLNPRPLPAPPMPAKAPLFEPKPPLPLPAVSTGIADLDGLLGSVLGRQGLPLGTISYFFGDEALTPNLLRCSPAATCTTIEAAFARIHLLPKGEKPLVIIALDMPEPTDALRLTLAEQLPILADTIKTHGQAAIAILSPDWQAKTPTLLNYIPTLGIKVTTHDKDNRFLTATLVKGTTTPYSVALPVAVSFPR